MKPIYVALSCLLVSSRMNAAERLPDVALEKMTPEQRHVADGIIAGPRKALTQPFTTWIRRPEFADRMQKVGEYIRYETSLPHRLNEFAILIAARYWGAQFEWYTHYPLAIQAGLKPSIAADLAGNKRPRDMQPDEAVVYDVSIRLQGRKADIPDPMFERAMQLLGSDGVIDLLAVNGYYAAVAMTLNAAQVKLPPGVPEPLK